MLEVYLVMKETRTLEYKEQVTNTFLKTVSAYANYGTGIIMFGVNDEGVRVGIKNPEQVCLDIENKINDSIDPVPHYTLHVDEKFSVITLTVEEGQHKPYFYKSKAYRRNDSATIEVDRLELTRLILEGQNMAYEELPAKVQEFKFTALEAELKEKLKIQEVSLDTLKTLELYSDENGYNNAAEIFSDNNGFCGIDIVRFGDTIDIFLDRETCVNESVISQYNDAVNMYRKYDQYEKVEGLTRNIHALIPEEAYREAIANALVHRTWDTRAHIKVAMFKDRIEITSPGGLTKGITPEDYLRGGLSILRNRIIGNIFFRLHLIERFGTGIRRITEAYRDSALKPNFEFHENSITVVLPVMLECYNLTEDEEKVYALLRGKAVASSAIIQATGFGKSKVLGIVKKLISDGYVKSIGSGRGMKYTLR